MHGGLCDEVLRLHPIPIVTALVSIAFRGFTKKFSFFVNQLKWLTLWLTIYFSGFTVECIGRVFVFYFLSSE